MTEYIRYTRVHIEVDTNKDTYVLDIDNAGIPEIQRQVAEFIGSHIGSPS